MALVFLNGGTPNYTGFEFSTALALIDQLETTLVSAGWTTVTKVSGVSLFIRGTTALNSHNCWVEFAVSGTTPNLTLTMRGWLEAAKTNGSPDAIHTATFTESGGAANRMWLTCDEDSGCITIFNSSTGACTGHHFGFLARQVPTDATAWMIGRIYVSSYNTAYVARSAVNSTIWRKLGADYLNATSDPLGVGNSSAYPLTTFDFMKRGVYQISNNMLTASDNTNMMYLAHRGGRNYEGSNIIDPYGYLEGKGSVDSYGVSNQNPLYFRGFVKHAFCGVSGEIAASQSIDTITGNRILSVGGLQWQGQRIL